MKKAAKKHTSGFCSYFSYNEDGRPPYGIYIIVILISVISLLLLWLLFDGILKDIILSVGASIFASLIVAFIFDRSRYESEKKNKIKLTKPLLRHFKFSAILFVLYVSHVLTKDEKEKEKLTGCEIIDDFIFDKYSDSDFKKNKELKSAAFDFVDEAEMLIGIERGILSSKHLAQLYQVKFAFIDYLSGYKDLRDVEAESDYNISRHKDFLGKLQGFLFANQEIFDRGGLLEDIGASSIEKLREKYKSDN